MSLYTLIHETATCIHNNTQKQQGTDKVNESTGKFLKNVMVALDLRPIENRIAIEDMQKVNSAYTREAELEKFIKSSEILYANKKSLSLLRSTALHYTVELQKEGFLGSISYNGRKVNIKGVPFDEAFRIKEHTAGDNEARAEMESKADNFKFQLDIDDDPEWNYYTNMVQEANQETRDNMNLGENIKAARKMAGMTQKELAERLQVYQKDISCWGWVP